MRLSWAGLRGDVTLAICSFSMFVIAPASCKLFSQRDAALGALESRAGAQRIRGRRGRAKVIKPPKSQSGMASGEVELVAAKLHILIQRQDGRLFFFSDRRRNHAAEEDAPYAFAISTCGGRRPHRNLALPAQNHSRNAQSHGRNGLYRSGKRRC